MAGLIVTGHRSGIYRVPCFFHIDNIKVLLLGHVDLGNPKRETDSGRVPKFVYSRQRKKTETMREVIEIDPQVNFANQEGEFDSRHETKIAYAHHKIKTETVKDAMGSVSSIFPYLNSIPRRPRTKVKRKFKGNVALSRSKEKLNSGVFDFYLAKIWRSFSEDRMRSFAYLDSLWFSLYRNAKCKDKVLSWINKEHIFTKEYVFVPIVCWGHWSLLIFCHFGENLQSFSRSRCMLLLDSLEMADPRRIEPEIRRFVQDIYKAGDRPETKSLISQIPFLVPKVPQQKDDTDCGNFVLYFIKLFLELAPDNFSMEGYPYFMKKDWFTFEELDSFCENLIR
ncbi:Cysteine proteinases superfamily protein [Trifolium repens]|nr:Cysteine proteinases superfamily protein [Trifolium repens]